MFNYLLTLCSAAFLFVTMPSQAADRGVSGMKLFNTSIAEAKSQVQPVVAPNVFSEKEALKISQAAIGHKIGDYTLTDRNGKKFRTADYLGKPLVISLIYTHCPVICATTTRSLSTIKASQDALGADSFGVLTVGFDTENDTPEAMADFAKRMGVNLTGWQFASADAETIKKLAKDLGFVYFPAEEGGFNHTTQTTFVDGQGKVYSQVYGEDFDNRVLLDPLKDLIYNIKTAQHGIDGFSSKVKLFCTVYNSIEGKYEISYSYFYGIGWSILISILITLWIRYEYLRSPKRTYPPADSQADDCIS